MYKHVIIRIVLAVFFLNSLGPLPDSHAQVLLDLPSPGMMVNTSGTYHPLTLKGILVNVKTPLRFDFLVDKGQSNLSGRPLKEEINRLVKYFLTCLTVPESDLWVNLSPYERDRIVPGNFGITLMGRDLLEQDYWLKQIMASLSYPENNLGKRFWQRVYRRSYELLGKTDIPVNTFNKVWIVPQSASVYAQGNGAFVVHSQLDVMLESDYKALIHSLGKDSQGFSSNAATYAQIFRDVILPELRHEVNEGKNFAVVRQVYHAMILATWYKRHLKGSFLGMTYVGKNQVTGVDIVDKNAKQEIFQQYLKAYKKCVYNYIKEDYDPIIQKTVPRKYISGGMDFVGFGLVGSSYNEDAMAQGVTGTDLAMATVDITARNTDGTLINAKGARFPDAGTLPNHLFASSIISSLFSMGGVGGMWAASYKPPTLTPAKNVRTDQDNNDHSQLVIPLPQSEETIQDKPRRFLGIAGWTSGMVLAGYFLGLHNPLTWAAAVALPFITRFYLASQVWAHEIVGHAIPEGILHPKEAKKVFTRNNLLANLSLKQWRDILLPWKRPKVEPQIIPVFENRADPRVAASGFFVSLTTGVALAASIFFVGMSHPWAASLLGPAIISSLAVLKASWESDIKNPQGKSYKCGNYGLFYMGNPRDGVTPRWVRDSMYDMLRRLLVRGGQSAGASTMIDGEYATDGQPRLVLTKEVKVKRGSRSNIASASVKGFFREAPKRLKPRGKGPRSTTQPRVFGVNGHVRYATGGPVFKSAAHPFVGPEEERKQWEFVEGQWRVATRKVFVVVSHNGDNDGFRLLGSELDLKEMRGFFPQLVHMKKNQRIPPVDSHSKSFYDYLSSGDSPVIAPQIHFLMTKGSWRASVRYAHIMINHQSAQEAMQDILTVAQEDAVANIFEEVFSNFTGKLKDQWVTRKMAQDDSNFEAQYQMINQLKEHILQKMNREVASRSLAGEVLSQWPSDEVTQKRFVDTVVRKFFTADRWQAVEEFSRSSIGTYGLVVRSSIQNDGVTIYSKGQGMVLGWNLRKRFFAFASSYSVLQGNFGGHGRMQELFSLDSRGEIADARLAQGKFYLRVHAMKEGRDLTADEILRRGYPQDERNRYYQASVEYQNPNRMLDEDLERASADVAKRLKAWDDRQSFDRQSADALAKLLASRFVEKYLKENSEYYPTVRVYAFNKLKALKQKEGLTPELKHFLEEQTHGLAGDSVIVRYVQNQAERFLAKKADQIAGEIMNGRTSSDDDRSGYIRGVDHVMMRFVDRQLQTLMQALTRNFKEEKEKLEAQQVKGIFDTNNETDLFITGYERSLWLGENLVNIIHMLMPGLRVKSTSSNKFLESPLDFGVNARTIAIVASVSGETFPSIHSADILHEMTQGNTFAITSRMDSRITMVLGQRLRDEDPFLGRTFLTGEYYPAEAAPTTDVLLFAEQILMVINLVKQLKANFPHHKPWGLTITDTEIKRLEAMVPGLLDDAHRITGVDENRKPMAQDVHKALVKQGRFLADHIRETPVVNLLNRLYVYGIFMFGGGGLSLLWKKFFGDPGPPLTSWKGFLITNADYFLTIFMSFFITTLLYRTWSKRPRWGRLGPPGIVIGDISAIHKIIAQYVKKLRAVAPGSMASAVYGANPNDQFIAREGIDVHRGIQVVFGLPLVKSSRDKVITTMKQINAIKNGIIYHLMQAGAEITSIGRQDFNDPDATTHHINIGGSEELLPQDSKLVQSIYNLSFDAFGRLLAYKVMFNALYAKASSIVRATTFSLNLGFIKINIILPQWLIWDRAKTYVETSQHTTRTPVSLDDGVLAEVHKVIAAIPDGEIGPSAGDEAPSISGRHSDMAMAAVFKSILFPLIVLGAISVSAVSAQAATFKKVENGQKIEVTVEKSDTFGQILLDTGFTKKATTMSLWGKEGLVVAIGDMVKDKISDTHWIYPQQVFVLPTPEEFLKQRQGVEEAHAATLVDQGPVTDEPGSPYNLKVTVIGENALQSLGASGSLSSSVRAQGDHGQGLRLFPNARSVILSGLPARQEAKDFNTRQNSSPFGLRVAAKMAGVQAGTPPPPDETFELLTAYLKQHFSSIVGFSVLGITLLGAGISRFRPKREELVEDSASSGDEPMPMVVVTRPSDHVALEESVADRAQRATHGGIDMNSRLMKLDMTQESNNQVEDNNSAMKNILITTAVPQVATIVPVTSHMLKRLLTTGLNAPN